LEGDRTTRRLVAGLALLCLFFAAPAIQSGLPALGVVLAGCGAALIGSLV